MRFCGVLDSRSSTRPNFGPPGESAIQALNPQRRDAILRLTEWDELHPGTLNVKVGSDVVPLLSKMAPNWREDGSDITYPLGFEYILKLRKAYLYFAGFAYYRDQSQSILIRIAENPISQLVELLAAVGIRETFDLSDGDSLEIAVGESNNVLH